MLDERTKKILTDEILLDIESIQSCFNEAKAELEKLNASIHDDPNKARMAAARLVTKTGSLLRNSKHAETLLEVRDDLF